MIRIVDTCWVSPDLIFPEPYELCFYHRGLTFIARWTGDFWEKLGDEGWEGLDHDPDFWCELPFPSPPSAATDV